MAPDRTANRAYRKLFLVIPILCCVDACSKDRGAKGPDPDETQLRAAIDAQLPRGSDIPKIEAFLKSNGFEYSTGSATGTINAIKRDVAKGGLVKKSIRVEFSTTDGKLESYKSDVVYTGP